MLEQHPDDIYFRQLDLEKKQKLRRKALEDAARHAVEQRRAKHFHHCGKCGASMDTQIHRGVEIEVCPECGAVLLDAGELEMLAGEDKGSFLEGFANLFRSPPVRRERESHP